MDKAIDKGYTFAWGADVSEKGFATVNPGVAVVPTTDTKEMSGAEIAKWEVCQKKQQNPDAFQKWSGSRETDYPGNETTRVR